MNTTMEEIKNYFELCKSYWMNQGDSEGVATSKAFWWDCIEVWNLDKSWNDEKRNFAMEFRGYKPGDPAPSEASVKVGGV